MELATLFSSLLHHHIATPAQPLPEAWPGITWIWHAGGVAKRGCGLGLDLLIPVGVSWAAPGLVALLPHVRIDGVSRIPAKALDHILQHAQLCSDGRAIARPIEQQYFITYRADRPWQPIRVSVPKQTATAGHIAYEATTPGRLLVDVHSHHEMAAYWSATDNRDDTGLSISAVIGRIYTRPEIALRLNVYGHHWRIPVDLVFDGLGPFVEAGEG